MKNLELLKTFVLYHLITLFSIMKVFFILFLENMVLMALLNCIKCNPIISDKTSACQMPNNIKAQEMAI